MQHIACSFGHTCDADVAYKLIQLGIVTCPMLKCSGLLPAVAIAFARSPLYIEIGAVDQSLMANDVAEERKKKSVSCGIYRHRWQQ